MNSQINKGPLQQIQFLLSKLSNYIIQVNSIIKEMNNFFNQMNAPLKNSINFNFNPTINNNISLNSNKFMNLENIKNKIKINAVFNVNECDLEIRKFANQGIINFAIDPDKNINDLLIEFYKRIGKDNNINEIKDKLFFYYLEKKLDFYDITTIRNFINIKDIKQNFFIIKVKQILI